MHSRPCLLGHSSGTGCPLASGLGRLLGNPRRQILEPFLAGPRTGEDRQPNADRKAQPKQPEQDPEPQSALLCRRWSQAGHAPVFITATGRLGRCLLGVEPRIRGRDGRYRLYWRLRHRRRGNGRCGSGAELSATIGAKAVRRVVFLSTVGASLHVENRPFRHKRTPTPQGATGPYSLR